MTGGTASQVTSAATAKAERNARSRKSVLERLAGVRSCASGGSLRLPSIGVSSPACGYAPNAQPRTSAADDISDPGWSAANHQLLTPDPPNGVVFLPCI